MITVVAIILIMTAILLGDLPNFRDKTSLDAIAQEVAIIIRQAQVFGSATRASAGNQFKSFGVYFNASNEDNFIVFSDLESPPNNSYDGLDCGTTTNECREQFFFNRGVEIQSLELCPSSSCSSVTPLNILFRRPFTDAWFYDGTGQSLSANYVKIKIAKVSKPNDTRSIIIWNTGHIYVDKT